IRDPAVHVLVIASPNRFHADHVIAASRSGTRAAVGETPPAGPAAPATTPGSSEGSTSGGAPATTPAPTSTSGS
ncbi:hypothetical protein C5C05_04685, partial [Clavibacter michiganensis]